MRTQSWAAGRRNMTFSDNNNFEFDVRIAYNCPHPRHNCLSTDNFLHLIVIFDKDLQGKRSRYVRNDSLQCKNMGVMVADLQSPEISPLFRLYLSENIAWLYC